VFTVPLHSNESYSIVVCVFVVTGIRLTSRFLAMDIYSYLTVPAFGCHVTVCSFNANNYNYNSFSLQDFSRDGLQPQVTHRSRSEIFCPRTRLR
jgi:hypothetical protein